MFALREAYETTFLFLELFFRQTCRTFISPPGATSSWLDGPSEKVPVQKTEVEVSTQNTEVD